MPPEPKLNEVHRYQTYYEDDEGNLVTATGVSIPWTSTEEVHTNASGIELPRTPTQTKRADLRNKLLRDDHRGGE